MDFDKISKDFATYVQDRAFIYGITDLALYGSVARKSSKPNDIDFLLVHQNPAFESIEKSKHSTKEFPLLRQFRILNEELKTFGYPSLDDLLEINSCKEAIISGKLRVVYLRNDFFKDEDYAKEVILRNEDPLFFENVFRDALLWDSKTNAFSLPFLNKYQKKISKPSEILI